MFSLFVQSRQRYINFVIISRNFIFLHSFSAFLNFIDLCPYTYSFVLYIFDYFVFLSYFRVDLSSFLTWVFNAMLRNVPISIALTAFHIFWYILFSFSFIQNSVVFSSLTHVSFSSILFICKFMLNSDLFVIDFH